MPDHEDRPAMQKTIETFFPELSAEEKARHLEESRKNALIEERLLLSAAYHQGRMMGRIQALQQILRRPIMSDEELLPKRNIELQELLNSLEAELM